VARPLTETLAFAALTLVALAGALATYWISVPVPNIPDDAFMFVRYTDNLFEHGRLAWNPDGPAVYGLTSPAYLLVVAPVRLVFPHQAAVTVLVASMLCFLVFWFALASLVARQLAGHGLKTLIVLAVMTGVLMGSNLRQHAVSGMDTMFALACVTLVIWLHLRLAAAGGLGTIVAVGAVTGLVYFARPDLVLFGLAGSAGLALFGDSREQRRRGWLALAVGGGVLGLSLLLAWLTMGTALPLPYYVKRFGLYGAGFERVYALASAGHLRGFLRDVWPFLLVLLVGVRGLRSLTAVEKGLLAGALMFTIYYLFFTVHIMGHHARFYMPVLPVLVLVAARLVGGWCRELPGPTHPGRVFAAVIALPVAVTLLGAFEARRLGAGPIPADADLRLTQVWLGIDDLHRHQDLRIAATEVGLLGVLAPQAEIIDMAGLHTPEYAFQAFSAERLLARPPDLIYMPHPDYLDMNASFDDHPTFRQLYEVHPGRWLGVAILRKGRYYRSLRAAVLQPPRQFATWRENYEAVQ
jgi:hypothetical protein